jgi:hypothetical protein
MGIVIAITKQGEERKLFIPEDVASLSTVQLEAVLTDNHMSIRNIVTIKTDLPCEVLPEHIAVSGLTDKISEEGDGSAAAVDHRASVAAMEVEASGAEVAEAGVARPIDLHRHLAQRVTGTAAVLLGTAGLAGIGFFIQWLATRKSGLPGSFGFLKPTARRRSLWRSNQAFITLRTRGQRTIEVVVPAGMVEIRSAWLAARLRERFIRRESIVEIDLPEQVTMLGKRAFYRFAGLTQINLPHVISVGQECFAQCRSLVSATMRRLESIGNAGFLQCVSLGELIMPELKSIGSWGFRGCVSLAAADLPKLHTIGDLGFHGCGLRQGISAPALREVGDFCFERSRIVIADFPMLIEVGGACFGGCGHLVIVNLPRVTELSQYVFSDCDSLRIVNLVSLVNFEINCFQYTNMRYVFLSAMSADDFNSKFNVSNERIQLIQVDSMGSMLKNAADARAHCSGMIEQLGVTGSKHQQTIRQVVQSAFFNPECIIASLCSDMARLAWVRKMPERKGGSASVRAALQDLPIQLRRCHASYLVGDEAAGFDRTIYANLTAFFEKSFANSFPKMRDLYLLILSYLAPGAVALIEKGCSHRVLSIFDGDDSAGLDVNRDIAAATSAVADGGGGGGGWG